MTTGVDQADFPQSPTTAGSATGSTVDTDATEVTPVTSTQEPEPDTASNGDFPWDKFDTSDYLAHNYRKLRADDTEIVTIVGDYFAEKCANHPNRGGLRGIDVGTGANLYPTLAMLPFCEQIRLLEFSTSNYEWLQEQQAGEWPSWPGTWQKFWDVLCHRPEYHQFAGANMPRELAKRTEVCQGSVLNMEVPQDGPFDIATMFFVAESISPKRSEFTIAMRHFLNVLRADAPFAIALMEHSHGYQVGDTFFPATDIDVKDVADFLGGSARDIVVKRIAPDGDPLRDGYTAMIIACGCVEKR